MLLSGSFTGRPNFTNAAVCAPVCSCLKMNGHKLHERLKKPQTWNLEKICSSKSKNSKILIFLGSFEGANQGEKKFPCTKSLLAYQNQYPPKCWEGLRSPKPKKIAVKLR